MALQDVFLYSQNWRFLDTKTYLPPNFLGGEKISQLIFFIFQPSKSNIKPKETTQSQSDHIYDK